MNGLKYGGGVLIHVIRPNYFSEATKGHPSNIPLSIGENDLVVINDDSLEVLQERVLKILKKNNLIYASEAFVEMH